MRISDWSSDVPSDGLQTPIGVPSARGVRRQSLRGASPTSCSRVGSCTASRYAVGALITRPIGSEGDLSRSEEHTSELQSLMRISYAVFCLKKKNIQHNTDE